MSCTLAWFYLFFSFIFCALESHVELQCEEHWGASDACSCILFLWDNRFRRVKSCHQQEENGFRHPHVKFDTYREFVIQNKIDHLQGGACCCIWTQALSEPPLSSRLYLTQSGPFEVDRFKAEREIFQVHNLDLRLVLHGCLFRYRGQSVFTAHADRVSWAFTVLRKVRNNSCTLVQVLTFSLHILAMVSSISSLRKLILKSMTCIMNTQLLGTPMVGCLN